MDQHFVLLYKSGSPLSLIYPTVDMLINGLPGMTTHIQLSLPVSCYQQKSRAAEKQWSTALHGFYNNQQSVKLELCLAQLYKMLVSHWCENPLHLTPCSGFLSAEICTVEDLSF